MSAEELRACLDASPNPETTDWNRWNTIGMRVYEASEGADYGLKEWETWSNNNPNSVVYEKDSCADRWATYHRSPPTRTGGGALVNEARAVLNDPKWLPRVVSTQVTPPPEKRNPLRGGKFSEHEALELINSHYFIGRDPK